jgi:hypothetical protein
LAAFLSKVSGVPDGVVKRALASVRRSFVFVNHQVFNLTDDGEDDEGQDRAHDSQAQPPSTGGDANGVAYLHSGVI